MNVEIGNEAMQFHFLVSNFRYSACLCSVDHCTCHTGSRKGIGVFVEANSGLINNYGLTSTFLAY